MAAAPKRGRRRKKKPNPTDDCFGTVLNGCLETTGVILD